MPLLIPEGWPTKAQRLNVGCADLDVHKSRQGRLNLCEIGQSSFQDLAQFALLQTDLFAFSVERGVVNSEDLSRFSQVGGSFQNFPQVGFLQLLQGDQ